jgi:hypothetical protein
MALLALLIEHADFGGLIAKDKALQNALIDSSAIAGPNNHDRADLHGDGGLTTPTNVPVTNTSWLPASGADMGILFRELTLSSDFYTAFSDKFGKQISSGIAASGMADPTVSLNGLHTGLVDLGLETLRDHVGVEADSGAFVVPSVAMDVFGDIAVDGYAIIHTTDILHGDVGGELAVDTAFQNALETRGISVSSVFPDVVSDPAAAQDPWKVLVVQAGSDTAAMTYAPQGADINLRHMIIGGNHGNTITASQAGDIVLGGAGDDAFIAGQGRDHHRRNWDWRP